MKRKISLGIIILLLLPMLAACQKEGPAPNSYEGIREKGKIVMGTSADFPLNEFHAMVNGEDRIVGYELALGEYIAQRLGVDFELVDMSFENLLNSLALGQVDMVIAGIGNNPGRDVNFTIPYDDGGGHNSLLIRKEDSPSYREMEDFEGGKLGAQLGTIQERLLKESGVDLELKTLSSIDSLVLELKTHKIDGICMANEAATAYEKTNDDLKIVDTIVLQYAEDEDKGNCVALKKGNDRLTEEINKIIVDLREEGLLDAWKEEAMEYINLQIEN